MTMRVDYREQLFVTEYLKDNTLNATQAAIRAGYSAKAARQIGTELVAKPSIAFAIKQEMDVRAMRNRISADRVLIEIARLALVDIRNLIGDDGAIKPIEAWDNDTAAAVTQIEVTELYEDVGGGEKVHTGRVKKVRLADKTRNLELLARHLGMVGKDKEAVQTFSDMLKAVLLEMSERAQPKDVTPAADWAPLAAEREGPPTATLLPAPPTPEEGAR
jgi:phage terminase small subunit